MSGSSTEANKEVYMLCDCRLIFLNRSCCPTSGAQQLEEPCLIRLVLAKVTSD